MEIIQSDHRKFDNEHNSIIAICGKDTKIISFPFPCSDDDTYGFYIQKKGENFTTTIELTKEEYEELNNEHYVIEHD